MENQELKRQRRLACSQKTKPCKDFRATDHNAKPYSFLVLGSSRFVGYWVFCGDGHQ
jgi:hypothetical protein